MRLLLKFPTRGRPQQFLKTLHGWLSNADDLSRISVLVSYDDDDATMTPEVVATAESMHPACVCVRGHSKSKIDACNRDLPEYGGVWDVVLLISDDMWCCRKGWDTAIRENMLKHFPDTGGALWFWDGAQRKINTLECVGRKRWESNGRVLYHPSYKSFFCLHPDTRIYMANQTTKRIADVTPGEFVVGSERRRPVGINKGDMTLEYLRPSLVTKVSSRVSEIVSIRLFSGAEIKCTPDHVWAYYGDGRKYMNSGLRSPSGSGTYLYGEAKVGRKLVRAINLPPPPPAGTEWKRGWLAAMMDAEGTFPRIAQSAGHNPIVCASLSERFSELGFRITNQPIDPSKYYPGGKILNNYYITGGRDEYLRFLDWMRPVKNATKDICKRMFTGRFGSKDAIVSIEPAGFGAVMCLTTETSNFVAEGILSHNCDNETSAVGLRDKKLVFIDQPIAHHQHPSWLGGMGD